MSTDTTTSTRHVWRINDLSDIGQVRPTCARSAPGARASITNHIWTVGELVDAALNGIVPEPQGRTVNQFTVIEGGKK